MGYAMTCSSCGKSDEGNYECPHCGHRRTREEVLAARANRTKTDPNSAALLGGLIVAFLVFVGIWVYRGATQEPRRTPARTSRLITTESSSPSLIESVESALVAGRGADAVHALTSFARQNPRNADIAEDLTTRVVEAGLKAIETLLERDSLAALNLAREVATFQPSDERLEALIERAEARRQTARTVPQKKLDAVATPLTVSGQGQTRVQRAVRDVFAELGAKETRCPASIVVPMRGVPGFRSASCAELSEGAALVKVRWDYADALKKHSIRATNPWADASALMPGTSSQVRWFKQGVAELMVVVGVMPDFPGVTVLIVVEKL